VARVPDGSERASERAPGRERWFFLEAEAGPRAARLRAEELAHATRVLRLADGAAIVALDGRGTARPMRLSLTGREPSLVERGAPWTEPRPGSAGALLPDVEVALSLPRPSRAEGMLERLVQLGAQRVTPLVTARTPPRARQLSSARRARFERIAREACKQSGRLWLPELGEPRSPAELAAASGERARVVLSPGAAEALAACVRRAASAGERAWTLVVGPEGGFEGSELEALESAGFEPAFLAPTVLRIETAAEAAVAIAVHAFVER